LTAVSHILLLLSVLSLLGCLRSAAQPNKVYVGGLPEGARQEDLQTCFGKIGNIVNIELKFVPYFQHPELHINHYLSQSWIRLRRK
jgi:hypothetical protein